MRSAMVVTILEGTVPEAQRITLADAYDSLSKADRPPGLVESFLLQATDDKTLWRLCTIWESTESLQKMRASGKTPTGVLIFQSVNVTPTLRIFSVEEYLGKLS
jgi:heme-degrading monooxygenase HmoA